MTSKKKRLKEAKLYQQVTNEALSCDDPEVWIDRYGMEMSLGVAMDDISEYIDACFRINENPLRHLRRYFPGFAWKFHEDVYEEKLASILKAVDYVWVTGLFSVGEGFVTATQIQGEKLRVLCFLASQREYSGWNSMIRKELKSCVPEIRFVENGNKEVVNTILS